MSRLASTQALRRDSRSARGSLFLPLLVLILLGLLFDAFSGALAAAPSRDDASLTAPLVPPPTPKSNRHHQLAFHSRFRGAPVRPSSSDDLVLADTLVLTTVEGGLYALDRRTGRQLWSLSPQTAHDSDSLLRPLVTSLYGKNQKSFADIVQGARSFASPFASGAVPELEAGGIYIVEPSSAGDIYVLSSKRDAVAASTSETPHVQLDKLPLTLPQLVELSPFSFAGDDTRVFVGQKQTTLVELNIQTGELAAVFGGRQSGVWCGAQSSDDPDVNSSVPESCIDDEPALSGFSSKSASQLAYVGRTDYTLNIHSRNTPEALQTLHFSTFAPNAGDRDIQALWMRADHPDQRAIMGMPEDGSVVCFNLTEADGHGEPRHTEQLSRPVWTSDLRASVANIFDVVYPAARLQNTKSLSRPILVAHPPIPLHKVFPQVNDGRTAPSAADAAYDVGKRQSAYLGIAGDSFFAMSASRFPLVAFTSKAVAGLSDGGAEREDVSASTWPSSVSRSPIGNRGNDRKCTSFGCWLGSYSLQVDTSAEGILQDSLLGAHLTLELDASQPRLAIGDSPAFPSLDNDTLERQRQRERERSRSHASSPPSTKDEKDEQQGRQDTGRPGARPRSDSDFESTESSDRQEASEITRWKSKLAMVLLQVIGVLVVAVLGGATYLGLQEQKARGERQAVEIAKGVVWIPVLKENEAGHAGDSAVAEKMRAEEDKELQQAIKLSQTVNSSVASSKKLPAEPSAVSDVEIDDKDVASTSVAKKKANKRRRRGKRGGAAAAAKVAKAASPDGDIDDAFDDNDIDDDEGPDENVDIAETEEHRPKIPKPLATLNSNEAAASDSASSAGNEPESPSTTRSTRPEKRSNKPVLSMRGSLQQAQDMLSPQPKSPLLGSGWNNVDDDEDAAASVGRAAAQIAAGAQSSSSASLDTINTSSLCISDEVLGYGSSGTVVFKGTFQGRAVAVKRLLRDFVHVASKEVSLLESADNHPNVIRYFFKELTPSFLFIALELCPASLSDVVERPADYRELSNLLEPKRALQQITSGLRHLHSLSIVHRDIKPQNILVATSSSGKSLKMLLSDFGLSKRLDGMAQTSFSQTVNNPGGTVGWRAPEILRGDVTLDTGSESESSVGNGASRTTEERQRLTRAVDIFALGCLGYYVLSNGDHPFGSRFEREMNIIRKHVDLARLDGLGEEGHEAQDLVLKMVSHDSRQRPSAAEVLTHPYFWDPNKRLNFLQDASDRFEIMDKDPPAASLVLLESKAKQVLGPDWHRRCDKMFLDNLGKFRKYDSSSVQDLLRAMRNKKHHYQDLPPSLKKIMGSLPDGYLSYFTRRFPELFLHVYNTIVQHSLIKTEPVFREYFQSTESDH